MLSCCSSGVRARVRRSICVEYMFLCPSPNCHSFSRQKQMKLTLSQNILFSPTIDNESCGGGENGDEASASSMM